MEKYYVYVYLDPRKPGNFVYKEFSFNFEPIYIGKGNRNRIKHHLKKRLTKNTLFYSKLNKIINSGFEPIFFKLVYSLNEDEALKIESQLINLIGRIDIETGSLCNMTDGGEIGFSRSPESRKKLSLSKMGDKNPMFGKTISNEHKDILKSYSKANKGKTWVELYDAETIERMLNGCANRGKNAKLREDTKKYKLIDPDGNEYIIDGMVRLQKFCSEKNIQYQLLRKNIGNKITPDKLKSKKITALNTLKWEIKKIV